MKKILHRVLQGTLMVSLCSSIALPATRAQSREGAALHTSDKGADNDSNSPTTHPNGLFDKADATISDDSQTNTNNVQVSITLTPNFKVANKGPITWSGILTLPTPAHSAPTVPDTDIKKVTKQTFTVEQTAHATSSQTATYKFKTTLCSSTNITKKTTIIVTYYKGKRNILTNKQLTLNPNTKCGTHTFTHNDSFAADETISYTAQYNKTNLGSGETQVKALEKAQSEISIRYTNPTAKQLIAQSQNNTTIVPLPLTVCASNLSASHTSATVVVSYMGDRKDSGITDQGDSIHGYWGDGDSVRSRGIGPGQQAKSTKPVSVDLPQATTKKTICKNISIDIPIDSDDTGVKIIETNVILNKLKRSTGSRYFSITHTSKPQPTPTPTQPKVGLTQISLTRGPTNGNDYTIKGNVCRSQSNPPLTSVPLHMTMIEERERERKTKNNKKVLTYQNQKKTVRIPSRGMCGAFSFGFDEQHLTSSSSSGKLKFKLETSASKSKNAKITYHLPLPPKPKPAPSLTIKHKNNTQDRVTGSIRGHKKIAPIPLEICTENLTTNTTAILTLRGYRTPPQDNTRQDPYTKEETIKLSNNTKCITHIASIAGSSNAIKLTLQGDIHLKDSKKTTILKKATYTVTEETTNNSTDSSHTLLDEIKNGSDVTPSPVFISTTKPTGTSSNTSSSSSASTSISQSVGPVIYDPSAFTHLYISK